MKIVIPGGTGQIGRLLDAGFSFAFPEWRQTAEDMVRRYA